jgi:hypothetical protein
MGWHTSPRFPLRSRSRPRSDHGFRRKGKLTHPPARMVSSEHRQVNERRRGPVGRAETEFAGRETITARRAAI